MTMASVPPNGMIRSMTNRQLTVLAAAVVLVASLPFALYALFGNPAAVRKPAQIAAKVTGAPVGNLPLPMIDDRPRLAIARVETQHIRAGGLRPGDEFHDILKLLAGELPRRRR